MAAARSSRVAEGGESRPLPKLPLDSVTIILMGGSGVMAIPAMVRGLIPQDERNPVWVCNHSIRVYQHTLAWNTHDLNRLREVEKDKGYDVLYANYNRPIVTLRPVPGLQTLIYPIGKVVEHWQDTYFWGALPYMLAYAGWCGVKHIRIFGADFDYEDRTDYEAGRACAEYWMGRLYSAGVAFEIPKVSTLRDYLWQDVGGRPVNGVPYGAPFYGYFGQQPKFRRGPDGKIKFVKLG